VHSLSLGGRCDLPACRAQVHRIDLGAFAKDAARGNPVSICY